MDNKLLVWITDFVDLPHLLEKLFFVDATFFSLSRVIIHLHFLSLFTNKTFTCFSGLHRWHSCFIFNFFVFLTQLTRLVLVGAESHGGHAALAATVEDPPNSSEPNEPAAPAHYLESPSESDTESLERDGLSQVAPEVLQEPSDADIHDPEGIVQDHLIGEMRINPAFRRGLESMDHVDLCACFDEGQLPERDEIDVACCCPSPFGR